MKTISITFLSVLLSVVCYAQYLDSNDPGGGITAQSDTSVGVLPGSFGVSPSGGATYTIPLDLPAGRAGMKPDIAFVYNSQQKFGNILGQGWSLTGFSAITRSNPTLYYNGGNDNIDFIDDELMFDGQHLIEVDQNEYRTEIDGISKIIELDGDNGMYFKVYTKDRLIIEYGNTVDSRQVYFGNNTDGVPLAWHINKITDRKGNTIVYTYEQAQQNGELHPEAIFYTGDNSKTLGSTKISFIYQSASMDSKIQHISYFEKNQLPYVNRNSWLLEKIQISNDDGTEPIKDYVINYYEQAGACKEFFVKDITLVNYEKGIATPIKPTRFYWDFYQPAYQQYSFSFEETGKYNNQSFRSIGLDMDGNKHDEIAFYFIERYYDEFGTYTDQNIIKVYGLNGGAIILPVSEPFHNLSSIDWDNNGDDELLFVDNNGITIYDYTNGTLSQVYTNSQTGQIYTGDINGDAINDILIEKPTELLVLEGYYNTSGIVDYVQSQYTLTLSTNLSIRTVADMNGDGNVEVLCKSSNYDNFFPTYSFSTQSGFSMLNNYAISGNIPTDSKFYYADFNGDGKTDICYLKKDNGSFIQNICFSYGNNFTEPQTSSYTFDEEPTVVVDINNDGRADFVYFDIHLFKLRMRSYLTNPDGISSQFQGEIELTDPISSFAHWKISTPNLIPNGTKGFIFIFERLVNYVGPTHQHWDDLFLCTFADLGIGNNVIKMIRDGFVVKTQITYSNFGTSGPIYSDFPISNPRFTDNIVSESYVEGDNNAQWDRKKYTFNTPITHLQGKGFLGYKETRVLSLQNNLLSITENNIHVDNDKYFYTYPMKSSTWSVVNEVQDKLLSETTNLVDLKKLNPGKLNFLPVVIQNITKSWDNDDAHTFKGKKVENQELSDIDNYGNILIHTTLMDESETPVSRYTWEQTIETHYLQPDEASWLVSLPDYSKTTMYHKPKAADESTLTNETYFHYYSASPYLEYKENIPNSNTDLKTENWYVYDDYGNITSETIKATINGATKERKTEFEYLYSEGYQSRFLTSKTVKAETAANDQIYTYTYNRYTGRIETSQDLNELGLTTYEYDDQGRLSKTTLPDLTQKVTFVNWSANFSEFTPPENALYYTLSYKNMSDASERWHNTCTFYDKYQRAIFAAMQGLNGNYYKTDQTFDNKGRVSQVSEPSPLNTSGLYTIYEYDNLGRMISQTLPTGSVITTEYAGLTTRVTNTTSGIWKETTVNILGNPQTVTDPTAEPVEYIYDAASRVSSFGTQDAMTTFEYDDAGNRTRVTDPDAGITQYTYNAFGELLTQTDARGSTFTNTYDELGRLETSSLTPDNISTIYTYNERTDYGFGQVKSVIQRTDGTDVSGIHYQYDRLGRLTSKVTNYEESSYGFEYEYSTRSGMLEYYTYPSLYKIKYEYNVYGYMTNVVENSTSNILWTAVGDNARGQLTDFTVGNGLLATHKDFDQYGFPNSITTVNPSTQVTIQDISYRFDPVTGNLDERTELITPGNFLTESYTYDGILQSRLTSWQVDGSRNYGMKYSNNGNILTKADVTQPPTMPKDGTPVGTEGQYTYGNNAGPHAVTGITLPTAEYLASATPQTITYNGFNKVSSILDNHEYGLNIDYGPDYQRIRSVFFRKNDPRFKAIQLLKTKYFLGDFEVEKYWENETEVTRQLHYLSSSSGIFAIIETKNGVTTPYYIHKDHLGNYNVITGGNGQVVEKLNFDPWGQRRNPTDWSYTNVPTSFLFDRGYTGHEHLDKFGLINMNGRVYDPRLARFLSPDPILQDPTNSQGHNRYSYCMNNPLRYVDPSGYAWGDGSGDDWWGDRHDKPLSENRENTPAYDFGNVPGVSWRDNSSGSYFNNTFGTESYNLLFVANGIFAEGDAAGALFEYIMSNGISSLFDKNDNPISSEDVNSCVNASGQGTPNYTEQSFSESGFHGTPTSAEGVGAAGGFFYSMSGKVLKDTHGQWYVYASASAWAPAAEKQADAITYYSSISVLENGKPIATKTGNLRVWDPEVTRIGQPNFTYIGDGYMPLPATGNNISVEISITYNMYKWWNGHAFPQFPYVYTINFK